MSDARLTAITNALLDFGKTIPAAALFPTDVPEAAEIATSNPYAFCIATCLDRGTKAEIIWTIPYDIKKKLGHLDPYRIYEMPLEGLEDLFKHLPHRPRYINDAPKTIRDLTRIVLDRTQMDIKPDTHTVLVLYRLGACEKSTNESAITATRRMNPAFPGELDGALWYIGREWCYANNPKCEECPVSAICAKQ